ncbi:MAG: methyltransferase [Alphaproteobacteria bacterium]|nr:methyltransferase [Alphaproteobacteria bacterium]
MIRQETGTNTTTDMLLGGRVKIVQPQDGYRVAVDPVLLAASIATPPNSRVLDVGCGTGAALFCLLSRLSTVQGVGLEQHEPFVKMARRGIQENDFSKRSEIVMGDLADPPDSWAAAFDVVMTNPPFFEAGTVPTRPGQDATHAVTDLSLRSWITRSLSLLRRDGLFSIIHRAERLADIIQALSGCGATTVIPLWPKTNTAAKRVIVTARKDRRSPATLCPGLVLHADDDTYTDEANAVLRDGETLQFLS